MGERQRGEARGLHQAPGHQHRAPAALVHPAPDPGRQIPLISSDQENAPSTAVRERCRSAATGPLMIAGR